MLTCYGANDGIMPNMDRRAAQAAVFYRAHCTQPICTPSRGSIVTGRCSRAHGAVTNNVPHRRDVKRRPEEFALPFFLAEQAIEFIDTHKARPCANARAGVHSRSAAGTL